MNDDVVYRQAAIDAVIKHLQLDYEYSWGVREAINALPSAEPEREMGRWMFSQDDAEGICTNCNYKIYGRPYNNTYLIVPYNFCPNCGADMRGEENG